MVIQHRNKKNIGKRLQKIRESIVDEKGKPLSKRKLAMRSGVLREYISKLENQKQKSISIDTAAKLAKGLGIPVGDLVEALLKEDTQEMN
jgi:transcriptional regulator with XRE-family HTH domain